MRPARMALVRARRQGNVGGAQVQKAPEKTSKSGKLRPRALRSKAILLTLTESWVMSKCNGGYVRAATIVADSAMKSLPVNKLFTRGASMRAHQCYHARWTHRFLYIP